MPRRLRTRRPSAALILAMLALVVALGGTSYAAIAITGAQIKDGTITSRDIRNRTLRAEDFRRPLPAGPQGAKGEPGEKGEQGEQGEQGEPGLDAPSPETPAADGLTRGEILAGVFDVQEEATQAGETFHVTLPFGHKLPARPTAVRLLDDPGSTSPDCQGSGADPDPAPGVLCIYVDGTGNAPVIRINFAGGANIVHLTGTGLRLRSSRPGPLLAFGGWAYKVP